MNLSCFEVISFDLKTNLGMVSAFDENDNELQLEFEFSPADSSVNFDADIYLTDTGYEYEPGHLYEALNDYVYGRMSE